jgi:cystathionine gamma-synthase
MTSSTSRSGASLVSLASTVSPSRSAVTAAVRAGIERDPFTGAVVPPIHLTSTFAFRGFGDQRTHDYTRSGNPTRDLLAEALAELEEGAGAVVTSTGMSAIALVGCLLKVGARIVAPHDGYGGTFRLFQGWQQRGLVEVEFVDFTDEPALTAALARPTAAVWIETPSNPLLRITDIRRVVELARPTGALIVVDNTFLSPVWQQPLTLGADIVVHSTTKYLNGHSDVVGGAVIAKDPAIHEQLAWWANAEGLSGAPFDSYLTLRGLRTLHVRLEQHGRNALALAEFLDGRQEVRAVHYPGLPGHPGHDLACRQQHGFGGIVTFELASGERGARALVEGLTCFSLAESLGGVESLISHPCTMTHRVMDPDAQARAGLTGGLLRLSVGIEHIDDLRTDLAAGLRRAALA